jgi:hypothetical protein
VLLLINPRMVQIRKATAISSSLRKDPQTALSFSVSIGSFSKRLPVAAKIALVTAETIAEVPGSPVSPGGSELGTMWTSMLGASFMRRIW